MVLAMRSRVLRGLGKRPIHLGAERRAVLHGGKRASPDERYVRVSAVPAERGRCIRERPGRAEDRACTGWSACILWELHVLHG